MNENLTSSEIDWTPWAQLLETDASSVVALVTVKDEISQAAREGCGKVTVDVGKATVRMLAVAGNLEPYRAQIAELRFADLALIDKLKTYALALVVAEAMSARNEEDPMPIAPRAEAMFKIRRELFLELELLKARGVIPEDQLRKPRTVGHNDLFSDVLGIATLFSREWPRLGPHLGGDPKRIEHAILAADDFMRALALSDQVKAKLRGAKLIRAAAWKLAFKAYREAQRVIQYLRFYEGDALELAPNLHDYGNKPNKKKKQKKGEGGPDTEGVREGTLEPDAPQKVFEATAVTSPKIEAVATRPVGALGRGRE